MLPSRLSTPVNDITPPFSRSLSHRHPGPQRRRSRACRRAIIHRTCQFRHFPLCAGSRRRGVEVPMLVNAGPCAALASFALAPAGVCRPGPRAAPALTGALATAGAGRIRGRPRSQSSCGAHARAGVLSALPSSLASRHRGLSALCHWQQCLHHAERGCWGLAHRGTRLQHPPGSSRCSPAAWCPDHARAVRCGSRRPRAGMHRGPRFAPPRRRGIRQAGGQARGLARERRGFAQ